MNEKQIIIKSLESRVKQLIGKHSRLTKALKKYPLISEEIAIEIDKIIIELNDTYQVLEKYK